MTAGQTKKSRALMYVQQTQHLNNRFTDKDSIINHLKQNFKDSEWAYILHNKDMENGVHKADHIHIAFYFDNARSPNSVAKMMGDKPQTVEVFSGRWGKNNMFAYLIHATPGAIEEGKHRYSENEVTANFDYSKFMGNVKSTAEANKLNIEDIQARIISGELILKDFYIDGKLGSKETAALFYSNNHTKIDKAIDSRYKLQMSNRREIDLEIIYIQGAAGSGKTVLAKEYAERKYGDYFITGSSNDAVQDYMGESVAIFDDARPSDFGASDWLKMLDPYNNKSSVTSRYYNKYLAVKCIIITTTTPFHEFFVYAKGKGAVDEPVSQFMRRFQVVINVEPEVDDLGNRYAVGQLYRIEKMPQVQSRIVGHSQIQYEHSLEKEDGKVIRVKIPEGDSTKVIDDVMRFFS